MKFNTKNKDKKIMFIIEIIVILIFLIVLIYGLSTVHIKCYKKGTDCGKFINEYSVTVTDEIIYKIECYDKYIEINNWIKLNYSDIGLPKSYLNTCEIEW